MATKFNDIEDYVFFKGNNPGVSSRIGWDNGDIRFVRYKFASPAEGSNKIEFIKDSIGLVGNSAAMPLRFFVSTDANLSEVLAVDYSSIGWELYSAASGGYYTFSAIVDFVLLPNTEYYLYIFPGTYENGSVYSWNYASTITVNLIGAAGLIRIREGDKELLTIPMVKVGGALVQHSATIKSGDSLNYCV